MYSPEGWGGPEGFGAFLDLLADIVSRRPVRSEPGARPCAGLRPAARGRLRQRPRRVLRQPVRRHGVPEHVLRVPRDRHLRARRLALRPVLVVVQQRLHRLAGRPDRYVGPVDGPHVGAGPRRRQLLRRRHRPCRRRGVEQAAPERAAAQLRRLGPHRLRAQRVHEGVHRRVPRQRRPAARWHGLPREPESVPRRGRGQAGGAARARGGAAAELAPPAGTARRGCPRELRAGIQCPSEVTQRAGPDPVSSDPDAALAGPRRRRSPPSTERRVARRSSNSRAAHTEARTCRWGRAKGAHRSA